MVVDIRLKTALESAMEAIAEDQMADAEKQLDDALTVLRRQALVNQLAGAMRSAERAVTTQPPRKPSSPSRKIFTNCRSDTPTGA